MGYTLNTNLSEVVAQYIHHFERASAQKKFADAIMEMETPDGRKVMVTAKEGRAMNQIDQKTNYIRLKDSQTLARWGRRSADAVIYS
jgi:hypothetical protein